MSNIRVYLDLEYCYPGMSENSGRPSSEDLRQIVQIGAIKYDHKTSQELDSLNILTIPTFTSELPIFFVTLTNISQQDIDSKGINFVDALKDLDNFCNGLDIYTFDKDWEVIEQNCSYYNLSSPFRNKPFKRIKPLLRKWGLDPNDYSSGTLYKAANIDMNGHVHNALHDVRSMAQATDYFEGF